MSVLRRLHCRSLIRQQRANLVPDEGVYGLPARRELGVIICKQPFGLRIANLSSHLIDCAYSANATTCNRCWAEPASVQSARTRPEVLSMTWVDTFNPIRPFELGNLVPCFN